MGKLLLWSPTQEDLPNFLASGQRMIKRRMRGMAQKDWSGVLDLRMQLVVLYHHLGIFSKY